MFFHREMLPIALWPIGPSNLDNKGLIFWAALSLENYCFRQLLVCYLQFLQHKKNVVSSKRVCICEWKMKIITVYNVESVGWILWFLFCDLLSMRGKSKIYLIHFFFVFNWKKVLWLNITFNATQYNIFSIYYYYYYNLKLLHKCWFTSLG